MSKRLQQRRLTILWNAVIANILLSKINGVPSDQIPLQIQSVFFKDSVSIDLVIFKTFEFLYFS